MGDELETDLLETLEARGGELFAEAERLAVPDADEQRYNEACDALEEVYAALTAIRSVRAARLERT